MKHKEGVSQATDSKQNMKQPAKISEKPSLRGECTEELQTIGQCQGKSLKHFPLNYLTPAKQATRGHTDEDHHSIAWTQRSLQGTLCLSDRGEKVTAT